MWENIIKTIVKPEQIQEVINSAVKGQKDIEDIKVLLADNLEEQKKTNFYLYRAEQRALKSRSEKY